MSSRWFCDSRIAEFRGRTARPRICKKTNLGPPERPGELLCLDTFYIGELKGVGKVWQVTACDVASSYGVARILPELTAAAVATFLRTVVVPAVRQAGWSVERVLRRSALGQRGAWHSVIEDTTPPAGAATVCAP
jgi:hypothetical protein